MFFKVSRSFCQKEFLPPQISQISFSYQSNPKSNLYYNKFRKKFCIHVFFPENLTLYGFQIVDHESVVRFPENQAYDRKTGKIEATFSKFL